MAKNSSQEKQFEFKVLLQQSQQIQAQVVDVERNIELLGSIIVNLEDLSKSKEGDDILIPLNAGLFLKGRLSNNKTLLMNVGAGTIVEKSFEESKKTIEKQIMELQGVIIKYEEELQKMNSRLMDLSKDVKS